MGEYFNAVTRLVMVVGNGLLASTFKSFEDKDSVIIFASGVSNSKCVDESEFEREFKLLELYKNKKMLLVYFSTSSIEDPYLSKSQYIKHKINIEQFIKTNFDKYLIVRLPNVVGKTKNPNTLTNFIFNCIVENKEMNIQLNASRYLIDIDDIFSYLEKVILNEPELNSTINLLVAEKLPVLDIVEAFEKHLNKQINKNILSNQGGDYLLEIDSIFNKYGFNELVRGDVYLNSLLVKYYST